MPNEFKVKNGLIVDQGGAYISGSSSITGSFSASLQSGHTFVGDANGISRAVPTSSFSAALPAGVVSGSSQIDITQTTGYTSFSQSLAGTDASQSVSILAASQSAWGAFQSASANSSSAATVDNIQNIRLNSVETFTASVSATNTFTASVAQTNTFTASIAGTNAFTASANLRLNALETTSASVISRIGSIESFTSSFSSSNATIENVQNIRLNSIETFTSSVARTNTFTASIAGTNTFTASVAGTNLFTSSIAGTNLFTASIAGTNAFTQSVNNSLNVLNTSTTSLNNFTASANASLTALNLSSASVSSFTASINASFTALNLSTASLNSRTGSYATTGSNTFQGNQTINGTLNVTNIIVTTITASTEFASGSTRFGGTNANTHEFTGSVRVTGSLDIVGPVTGTSFAGQINANNGVVSGSSQIQLTSVTGYTAFSQSFAGTNQSASISTLIVSQSAWGAFQSASANSSSAATVDNVQNIRLNSLETFTSSVAGTNIFTASLAGTNLFTASIAGTNQFTQSANLRLNSIESFTSSFSSSNATIENIQNIRLNSVETFTSSVAGTNLFTASVAGTNLFTASVAGTNLFTASIAGTNAFTSSTNVRISSIESFTSSVARTNTFTASLAGTNLFTASIAATNTFTASTNIRLNSIETFTSSVAGTNLFTASANASLTALNLSTASLNSRTGSYATTGSNTFIGNETISGSLIVTGSTILSGSSIITGSLTIVTNQLATARGFTISSTAPSGSSGYNVFMGVPIPTLVSSGSNGAAFNTAIGFQALKDLKTGFSNTAIGNSALSANSTGSDNTAIGSNSMIVANSTFGDGMKNVAIGSFALFAAADTNNNTAIGAYSLGGLINSGVKPNDNIAIGTFAGRVYGADTFNTFSTGSIFIGVSTKPSTFNSTNEIVIGTNAVGNGNNSITLGNTDITKTILRSGVGIGTPSPTTALHVVGQLRLASYTTTTSYTGTSVGVLAFDSSGNILTIATPGGGSGTPGGSNTQIQYNNGGAFGGVPTLTYDGTTLRATGSFTGSFTGTILSNNGVVSGSSQIDITQTTGYTTFSQSLATTDSTTNNSLIALNLSTASINSKTGSYAITGSNTFQGNQIITGSLLISASITSSSDIRVSGHTIGRGGGNISTNVVMGTGALQNNTTGTDNVAIGDRALFATTVLANRNIAIGTSALANTTTGGENIAIGFAALSASDASSGARNIAIGSEALRFNRAGNDSIAIGDSVMTAYVLGSSNIALGLNALDNMVTGSYNIAIGGNAGSLISTFLANNTAATYSIYIGENSYPSQSNSTNEIVIGSNNTGHGSNTVTLGNTDITRTILRSNVGIGTITPSTALHVVGTSLVSGSAVVTGSLIITTAASVTNPAITISTIGAAGGAGSNLFIGTPPTTLTSAGVNNIGIGRAAADALTSGAGNTALGLGALSSITFGSDNVAIGRSALAIGGISINQNSGSNNVVIGSQALQGAADTSHNAVVGAFAMGNNTGDTATSGHNTALGSNAGRYYGSGVDILSDSTGSIYIGAFSRGSTFISNNEIVIGAGAVGSGNNSVTLGNTSITKTILRSNVGIGTSNPQHIIHVSSSSSPTIMAQSADSTGGQFRAKNTRGEFVKGLEGSTAGGWMDYDVINSQYITLYRTGSAGFYSIYTNGGERITVLGSNGNVGINAPSPTTALHVVGQLRLASYTTTTSYAGTAAGVLAFDSSGNILTIATPGGGSGTPGGSNTQIQYNNGGAFGGVPVLTYDGTTLRVTGSILANNGIVSGSSQIDITQTTGYTTFSQSVATTDTTQTLQITSLNSRTGSYATTGSNTFQGNQSIVGAVSASSFTGSGASLTGIVTQIVAGTNVTISPVGGTGVVTINSSGGGGISDGDKGDITVSSGGTVWTIDNSVVTVAKISATGTPSATTFLRGDGSWSTPAGGGGGTGTIILTAAGGWPSLTNGCQPPQSAQTATNLVNFYYLGFPDGATTTNANWAIPMPADYNGGTITAKFYWSANNASTAPVVWGLQARAYPDNSALEAAFGTAQEVADANQGTRFVNISAATSAITIGGTPAAGNFVQFRAYRIPSAAGDTLAATAELLSIHITYTKT